MRKVFLPILATLALCSAGTGCFISDELDKGNAIMDQHSGRANHDAEKAEDSDGKGAGGLAAWKARGRETVDKLNETVEEATKKELDPENVIIRCEIDGRVQYTRSFDCASIGGNMVMR